MQNIRENAFENVACQMAAILSWGDELKRVRHIIATRLNNSLIIHLTIDILLSSLVFI